MVQKKLYKSKKWRADILLKSYANVFGSLTEKNFAEFSATKLRELCDVLLRKSFYVKKNRNVLIASSPGKVVRKKIPWLVDDPDYTSNI